MTALLTIAEFGREIGMSERYVRYRIADGTIAPVIHLGRAVRIPRSTLDSFIQARIAEATASSAVHLDRGA